MTEPKHRADTHPALVGVAAARAKATLLADGRNRALRTFLQQVTFDVVAALGLLLLPVFTKAQGWGDIDWRVLGFLVAKTVVVTVLSYLMRTVLDRSKVPTPLPPSDPGEPDAEAA